MSADNRVTMTRVIVGVASVGATLALVYLYNKFQDRKNKSSGSGSGTSGRIRRQSAKSGEVKKVTFKTSEEDEEKDHRSMKESSAAVQNNSKSLSKVSQSQELVKEPSLKSVAMHDATKNENVIDKGDTVPEKSTVISTAPGAGCSSQDDSTTNCNSYENNSTLKLEDSTVINNTSISHTPSVVPATPAEPGVLVEEVIERSRDGPLMTSTPLPPSKDSNVRLRPAAAVFEPHSDLPSKAAQQKNQVDGNGPSEGNPEDIDFDVHQLRREMRIPRDIVPGLIGKRGSNIKAIQAQSGCNITFRDETLENGDRICVIRGAPESVPYGQSLIEKFIQEQPIIYTETLTVPLSSVGRIIGKGGDTIRSIQERSKARVNVESHNHYGSGDAGPTRTITIKGSELQISAARQFIYEKVEEERNLRRSINDATASRTHRRGGGTTSPSHSAPGSQSQGSTSPTSSEQVLPLKQDGILEIFVSCVYHPNDFWIQVVGRDAIELDKLCESMTDHYNSWDKEDTAGEQQFAPGDIVAAPFEVDGKIYRAKIMRIDDNRVEVSYLDYGDKRILPISEVHELHPKFLNLRFQAIQATLNLGCIGEKWEDEVINTFCDLTYCAQWQSLTARVKNYLKDAEDGHDVICIELLDKDVNIGEELVRKGLATPKGPSGCNGAQGVSVQKKSYAAVALGSSSSSSVDSKPVISSADPTLLESMEKEGDRNGNGN